MNILIIPSWYISDTNPIRGSFFREQAVAIAKAGHNVVVGYVYMRSIKELKFKSLYQIMKIEADGIKEIVYSVPSFGSIYRGTWFERNVKFYRVLMKKILKSYPVDVIHVHSFVPAGYAIAKLKSEVRLPIVYTEHFSGIVKGNMSEEYERALAFTIEQSNISIAVGSQLRNVMTKYSSKKIEVIPNILSPLFCPRPYFQKRENDFFHFISVGNLIPNKMHDLSILAFHKAFPEDNNVEFNILGQGIERENLEKLIFELGEEKRVHLLGLKSRKDTAELVRNSDVFVLASKNETFGVAYIEAMASGVPVIGTRNGGFESIYYDGCGEIVDIDNLEMLKSAFFRIKNEYHKYDRRSIAQTAQMRYGENTIVPMLEDVYRRVVRES